MPSSFYISVDTGRHRTRTKKAQDIKLQQAVLEDPLDFKAFRDSLTNDNPPVGISPAVIGLWWDAKGNWTKAHDVIQDDPSSETDWVHAYLHRKEGDESNAEYWYARAEKRPAQSSLDEEWATIARSLLGA